MQDFGYNPMSGCAPMLINFLVMFGVIEVVYRPLQRIFHIGSAAISAASEALTALGISFTTVTCDTNIIAQVMAGEPTVSSAFTAEQLSTITEFGQHMDFFGIDLTRVPQYNLSADNLPLLILPILAIVTMFISTHISMKASGQQMQGSMKARPCCLVAVLTSSAVLRNSVPARSLVLRGKRVIADRAGQRF